MPIVAAGLTIFASLWLAYYAESGRKYARAIYSDSVLPITDVNTEKGDQFLKLRRQRERAICMGSILVAGYIYAQVPVIAHNAGKSFVADFYTPAFIEGVIAILCLFAIARLYTSKAVSSLRMRLKTGTPEQKYLEVQNFVNNLHFNFTAAAATFMILVFAVAFTKIAYTVFQESSEKVQIFATTSVSQTTSAGNNTFPAQDGKVREGTDRAENPKSATSITSSTTTAPLGHETSNEKKVAEREIIIDILGAVELVIVAPLPYLLMLGLGRYIDAMAQPIEKRKAMVREARAELLDFKAFEVALLIAVLATVMIGYALQQHGQITWQPFAGASILLLLLIGYFISLELLGREHEPQEGDGDQAKSD